MNNIQITENYSITMCYDLRGLEQENYVKVLLGGIFSEKASLELTYISRKNQVAK